MKTPTEFKVSKEFRAFQSFSNITRVVPSFILEFDGKLLFGLSTTKKFNRSFSCIDELQKAFSDKYPVLWNRGERWQ